MFLLLKSIKNLTNLKNKKYFCKNFIKNINFVLATCKIGFLVFICETYLNICKKITIYLLIFKAVIVLLVIISWCSILHYLDWYNKTELTERRFLLFIVNNNVERHWIQEFSRVITKYQIISKRSVCLSFHPVSSIPMIRSKKIRNIHRLLEAFFVLYCSIKYQKEFYFKLNYSGG